MSEEQKNAVQEAENLETEKTVNKESETPEENEEVDEEVQEDEQPKDEVDHKAELEKAQRIISHKEEIIKTEKERRKELEGRQEEKGEADKIAELQKKQEEELNNFKYSVLQDKLDEEVYKLAKSDDEAELMKFHLKNTIKFGYTVKEIKEAVKTAWLKANEKRILNTNKELAEALKSGLTKTTSPSSSGQPQGANKPQYSKTEKKFLRKYGVEV